MAPAHGRKTWCAPGNGVAWARVLARGSAGPEAWPVWQRLPIHLRQAVSCALQGALSRKMLGVAPAAARGRGELECFSPVDLAAADTALGG